MELIFTIEEFRTVVHALRRQLDSRAEQPKNDPVAPLLDKFLNRDFGFGIDELEVLQESLEEERRRLNNPEATLSDDERIASPHTQRVLEQIIDKVVEASAMV